MCVIWNGTRCPSPSTLSLDGGTRIMPTHRPTPNALDWKRICGMCAETSSSTEWRIKFINSWDESVNQWVIVPRRTIQSNWAGEKEREMAWMIFVVVIRRYHLIFDRARKPQKREGSIVSRSIRFLDLYMLFSLMNKSFILHKFIAIRRLRRASFLFFFFLVILILFSFISVTHSVLCKTQNSSLLWHSLHWGERNVDDGNGRTNSVAHSFANKIVCVCVCGGYGI